MSFLPTRTVLTLGAATLLLSPACARLFGPTIQIVPNEHSMSVSAETVEADRAQCEEIADEVQKEYGPYPNDNTFSEAARIFGYHNRYASSCLRAKGYVIKRHKPIDLPASAISKARNPEGTPK